MTTRQAPHAPTLPGRTSPTLPWLAALGVMTMWASSFIVIRAGGGHFSPGPLSLLRVASAAAATIPLIAMRRVRLPRAPRVMLPVLGWGVAWFAVYTIALNAAERSIDAATAAMLVNIAPLIVAVASGVLLGEGVSPRLLIGIAVAFGGVVLITLATSTGHVSPSGIVLALVSTLLYAGCVLVQKPLLAHVDSTSMTVVGIWAALLACLPVAPRLLTELGTSPAASTLSVVYLGVFPTTVAFLLWGFALTRIPAGVLSSSSLVVPAITLVLAWLLLGEAPPALAALGGALCLVGAAFAVAPSMLAAMRSRP